MKPNNPGQTNPEPPTSTPQQPPEQLSKPVAAAAKKNPAPRPSPPPVAQAKKPAAAATQQPVQSEAPLPASISKASEITGTPSVRARAGSFLNQNPPKPQPPTQKSNRTAPISSSEEHQKPQSESIELAGATSPTKPKQPPAPSVKKVLHRATASSPNLKAGFPEVFAKSAATAPAIPVVPINTIPTNALQEEVSGTKVAQEQKPGNPGRSLQDIRANLEKTYSQGNLKAGAILKPVAKPTPVQTVTSTASTELAEPTPNPAKQAPQKPIRNANGSFVPPPLPSRPVVGVKQLGTQSPLSTTDDRKSVQLTAVIQERFQQKPVLKKAVIHQRFASESVLSNSQNPAATSPNAESAKEPAIGQTPTLVTTPPVIPPVTPVSTATNTSTTTGSTPASSDVASNGLAGEGGIKAATAQANQPQLVAVPGPLDTFLGWLGVKTEDKTPPTVQDQLPVALQNINPSQVAESNKVSEQQRAVEKLNKVPESEVEPELQEKLTQQQGKITPRSSAKEPKVETVQKPEENKNSDVSTSKEEVSKKVEPQAIQSAEPKNESVKPTAAHPPILQQFFTPVDESERVQRYKFAKYAKKTENLSKLYNSISLLSKEISSGNFKESKMLIAYALQKLTIQGAEDLDPNAKQVIREFVIMIEPAFIAVIKGGSFRFNKDIIKLGVDLFKDFRELSKRLNAPKELDSIIATLVDSFKHKQINASENMPEKEKLELAKERQENTAILAACSGYYVDNNIEVWEKMFQDAKDTSNEAFNEFLSAGIPANIFNEKMTALFSSILCQSTEKNSVSPSNS